ncbi:membrane dipeptidase [Viridibacillus sp. FSL H7-0596]|uniref:dipeptidase n=1 Tax=Viridibacillus sp. FSL H7-0596 TaxID=1928923 RepID=UPI00096E383F|nr:dipeptidase [Viridibacillus sp. FSL H7-0596]OMC88463.1 membrane dipeptidase [Viridibacillus sp. FSL H7-0596]
MENQFFVQKNQNSPLVIDGHSDLLSDVQIQREKGRRKVIETDYYERLAAGGVNIIVAALYVDSSFLPEMGLRKALGQISYLYEEVQESPEKLMICYNGEDMERAKQMGKIGFLLSIEGAEPIGTDLSLLRVFYELGVRNLGLVWSRRNAVGDGSFFQPIREGRKGGITSFGVKVIEEAEKLGITIDVSHLNDEGFWDVMEISKKPIIASHSNARSLCSTMRNLTDEQILAIASKNGVIGVNAASLLVADEDTNCNIEYLINHVDHLVKVAGIQHVGIGLDLCEDLIKYMSPADLANIPRKPFDVISGHQEIPLFIEGLIDRGYKGNEIEALLGGNFLRIFKG